MLGRALTFPFAVSSGGTSPAGSSGSRVVSAGTPVAAPALVATTAGRPRSTWTAAKPTPTDTTASTATSAAMRRFGARGIGADVPVRVGFVPTSSGTDPLRAGDGISTVWAFPAPGVDVSTRTLCCSKRRSGDDGIGGVVRPTADSIDARRSERISRALW